MRRILFAAALMATFPVAAQADAYRQCLSKLRPAALAAGVSGATYDRITAATEPDMEVLDFLNRQPEFKTAIWDYVAGLVDEERVAEGRALFAGNRALLERLGARYGVDPATVVAIWGVESNFGKQQGRRYLTRSLSTLSCFGRRQAFFRKEFFTTLRIIQNGDVNPDHLVGSWAGAFGQTQFMPTTFMRLAVDGDGDGRRDIVDSVADALASTANYLDKSGWIEGGVWGYEVRLPQGFRASLAGRTKKRPIGEWAAMGVTRIDGSPLRGNIRVGILTPAGVRGPAFVVTRNFDAIYAYNAAESYALSIAYLSDRIRGQGEWVTPWPTDDLGLARAGRRELQTILANKGYDIGNIDGIIGTKTREAIAAEERKLGWEPTGRAGERILRALRGG